MAYNVNAAFDAFDAEVRFTGVDRFGTPKLQGPFQRRESREELAKKAFRGRLRLKGQRTPLTYPQMGPQPFVGPPVPTNLLNVGQQEIIKNSLLNAAQITANAYPTVGRQAQTGAAVGAATRSAMGGGTMGQAVGLATSVATTAALSTGGGAAAAGAGAAGAGATAGLAAVLGPLAIAAFAIMAFSSINAAKKQRKALKKAQQAQKDIFKTKVAMYRNREQLENLVLTDNLNQTERQATKSRAALNTAKGETLSGATYNILQMAHRRNELEFKERLIDKNIQKRIAMREQLVVDYHRTRVKMESIADQNPTNGEIALGIIGSGLQTAMSYYGAVGDPSAPQTA